jgi:methionyl-tRNA synthetase
MSEAHRFYVTTPIYYVNDRPHIGHSYTTILADVLARYHRLFGDEVRFQTGTDEHGQKVQQSAAARGITPQQQCDEYSARFKEMWELLGIAPDRFIRTTEEGHKKTVQVILQRLFDQGDIYKDTYSGWYNVSDEMFISDSEVTDEGKESGRIIQVSETNYFFKLSKYQDWLVDYLEKENPEFIVPESRRNEVLGLLRDPVADLCISRPKARLSWGIELPFDRDYVSYVWIDALVNYISGLDWPGSPEFQKWWPHALHLIGKDILKPHGFFWPILLKASGIPLPQRILAHGWWTRGGLKESKTVTKDLAAQAPVRHIRELVEEYGVEPMRYYLIRDMTLGMDQDYSEELIVNRLNSELANDLGNLVNRVVKLITQNCESKVPPLSAKSPDESEAVRAGREVLDQMDRLPGEVACLIAGLKPNLALEGIINLVRRVNAYIAECEPWKKAKEGDLESAGHCLAIAIQALRVVAVLLHPVMPNRMEALLAQIGASLPAGGLHTDLLKEEGLPEGSPVPGGDPLFPRLDWKEISKKLETLVQDSGDQKGEGATPEMEESLVSIDEFFKTHLRVAVVVEAERVPKADKLLRLQVRIGEETRQIVAGVAEYYAPEDMVGKQIVVVANLKPAKIRGIDSQGMLLAAREGKNLRLLTLDGEGIGPGAEVG